MKSRNILSDVERSLVGNDPLDLHFFKNYIKRLILKHFWWFQSNLNYENCINLITLRELNPVQSGETLKFAVAQFSWFHRCMLICFKWYIPVIYMHRIYPTFIYVYVNGYFVCAISHIGIYIL